MVPVTFTVFIWNEPGLIAVWTNECCTLRHHLLRRRRRITSITIQLSKQTAVQYSSRPADPGQPGGSFEIFINSSKHLSPGILPRLTFHRDRREAFMPTCDIRGAKCYRSLKAYFSGIPLRHLICWSNFAIQSCLSISIISNVLPVEL